MTDYEKIKTNLDEIGIEYKETVSEYSYKNSFTSDQIDRVDTKIKFDELIKEINESEDGRLPEIDLTSSVLGYGFCTLLFTPKTFRFIGIEAE